MVGRPLSKVPHHSKDGLGGGTVGGGVEEPPDLRQTVQLNHKQTLSLLRSLRIQQKDKLLGQVDKLSVMGGGLEGGAPIENTVIN